MLCCILLAGLAFKIPYLDAYLYNPDEGWQIFAASKPDWLSALRYNYADITHPPFIILLLHGLLQIHDAVWVPRLAGIITSLLLGFAGYHLGKAATQNRTVGLLLALTFTLAPPFNYLALVVRGYIYMTLFLVCGLIFYFRFVKKQRSHDLALYMLSMALAVFTEYCATAVIFVCGFVHFFVLCKKHPIWHRQTMVWGAVHLALALWFLAGYLQHPFISGESTWNWLGDSVNRTGHLYTILLLSAFYPFMQFGFVEALSALYAISAWKKLRAYPFFVSYVCTPFFLLLVISFIADIAGIYPFSFLGRHGVYVAPFALLAIYFGLLQSLKEQIREPRWLPVFALGLHVLSNLTVYTHTPPHEFLFPKSELPPLKQALGKLPKGSVILADNQAQLMLLKSGIVDSVVTDLRHVTLHIGDASMVILNQMMLPLKHKNSTTSGELFLPPSDFDRLLNDLSPGQPTMYVMEMGFTHQLLTTQCRKEASSYLRLVYQTPYVKLYAYSPAQGRRLAKECITRLGK